MRLDLPGRRLCQQLARRQQNEHQASTRAAQRAAAIRHRRPIHTIIIVAEPRAGHSALSVVLEALVILLDELLVAGREFFLNGAIDGVAVLVAQLAPGALRTAAV